MRTLLVTGPGGSGRTTVAAATALAAARRGTRTLVLSTDPVDSLGAALGLPVGAEPVTVEPGLTALRPDPAEAFRRALLGLQDRAASALDLLGAGRLDGEELTPLPGARELALLRALRAISTARAARPADAAQALAGERPSSEPLSSEPLSGEPHADDLRAGHLRAGDLRADDPLACELLVVDLPPVVEALAALALPAQLRRYLQRLLPPERQAARALRPVLGRLAGVPLPAEALYAMAARWDGELAAAQALVESPDTGVLLVAEPGPAAAEAVRTAVAGLALHLLDVRALAANRLLPSGAHGPWGEALLVQQRKTLAEWRDCGWWPADGGPFPTEVPHLGHDPQGTDDLAALAVPGADQLLGGQRLLGGEGPLARPDRDDSWPERDDPWPVRDRLAEDGLLLWRIPLPGAVRGELDLVRRGTELALSVGPFRRIVPLPSALRRCRVAGAALREGVLELRFAPDPDLWPKER
ncbi:ArsA family ATPase [Streptomyces sp. NA04227]|uniref:ArsA family ATPase n=1 Tax=Streptomyces sp. NA04227 TaxID=2742136 RepID=UPI001590E6E9|nr:ArsA-related P-loop ATPase [Streptomyces sp. NA04227]QKW06034.1 ArsA family ATPase [Streptomyces sp. NA04227]